MKSTQPAHKTADPTTEREALLRSEREANKHQPRNFKDDALTDKVVSVAPDGTGPTPTETFDPKVDQALGSGNDGGHVTQPEPEREREPKLTRRQVGNQQ